MHLWTLLENRLWPDRAASRPHVVSLDALAPFFRRLAAMLGAGVHLVRALDFLAESEDDPALRGVLQEMVRGLNGGKRLSDTMRTPRMQRVFDPVMVGLIGLGEKTGALLAVMERLADMTESHLKMRKSVQSALVYPAALVVVTVMVGLIFVAFLGNKDQGLFALFGVDLPWPTQCIVNLSTALRNKFFWLAAIAATALPVYAFRARMRASRSFRRAVHTFLLHVPVMGSLTRKAASARILYIMSNSLAVGVPLLESLRLARAVCTNERIKDALDATRSYFSDGASLSEALRQGEVFPSLVISMVALGEEAGNLDQVLRRVTLIFEEDVESALDNATRLVEPILLGICGIMASFLALATLMPIVQVVNKF